MAYANMRGSVPRWRNIYANERDRPRARFPKQKSIAQKNLQIDELLRSGLSFRKACSMTVGLSQSPGDFPGFTGKGKHRQQRQQRKFDRMWIDQLYRLQGKTEVWQMAQTQVPKMESNKRLTLLQHF